MWQRYLLLILCCFGFYSDATEIPSPLITKEPEANVSENLTVVEGMPEIVTPPGIETTVYYGNAKFVCNVVGVPKPDVQWKKDGQNVSDKRFRVTDDGSLEITNVMASDAGNYQCYVSNKFGSVSANGTLLLKQSTYLFHPPASSRTKIGDSVEFICRAEVDTSVELKIDWLKDGIIIDYTDSRFQKWDNYVDLRRSILSISNTVKSDSGEYTCVAYTDFDRVEATATLNILGVPNPPILTKVECFNNSAIVSWEPLNDMGAILVGYYIIANISFPPFTKYIEQPFGEHTYNVSLSPWMNYTFRVIAVSEIGQESPPSDYSQVCTTPTDVPHKNPENVKGKSSNPNNMVIRWTPMTEIDHNAPNFYYQVWWKKDLTTEMWQYIEITNWTQSSLIISDTPVYQRYRIKVVACNEVGQANVAAQEVIGYSGEAKPTESPGNFTVFNVTASGRVLLGWDKVSIDSVNGKFEGYKLKIWTEDGPEDSREFEIKSDVNRFSVVALKPATKYFSHIMVVNGRYNGPASNTVSFTTLEGLPGEVESMKIVRLGSTAFWVTWQPPLEPNGQITGYNVYYRKLNGYLDIYPIRHREIPDPRVTSVKLNDFKPTESYTIGVHATTNAGEGRGTYFMDMELRASSFVPDIPNFTWEKIPTVASIKVQWRPYGVKSGSHFFANYRKKDEPNWESTEHELNEDYLVIRDLDPSSTYEIRVSAVNGEHVTESQSQFVKMNSNVES